MLDFKLLKVGYCTHPECFAVRGGKLKSAEFPALCCLIKHPEKGNILYDTGYSDKFSELTQSLPNLIYRKVTPVFFNKETDCLVGQLNRLGLTADDIKHVIISHFHADHMCGLHQFEKSQFIYSRSEYEKLTNMHKLFQLKNAFLKELIPDDFDSRSVDTDLLTVSENAVISGFAGADLFGDQSMHLIPLGGHTEIQLGLTFLSELGRVFLVADAAFGVKYLREKRPPSPLVNVINFSANEYEFVFNKLSYLVNSDNDLIIIPSHCTESWTKYGTTP